MSATGNWQAVLRSDAAMFRKRVALFHLDADDREAERRAEQRRRLRAEMEESESV